MSGAPRHQPVRSDPAAARKRALAEPAWVRRLLIGITVTFLVLLLVVPLLSVFVEGLRLGWHAYLNAFADPRTRASFRLTFLVVAIAVPLNLVFGLCASWAITRFDFRGKGLLLTLIDLPISVSPVVSGMVYVLLFGAHGWFGSWLAAHDIKIIFAVPGIVLATVFVTFPYVARELIPVMEEQGREQEEAARLLGAGGWAILFRVTLPRVKWALLYGVMLCTARAIGEFGAVAVVAGGRDGTMTIPLRILFLHDSMKNSVHMAAFSVASSLALLALVTLVLKVWLERRSKESTWASSSIESARPSAPGLPSATSAST
ncbi:MAG TPA: sulfate ABC transporter permease subunit CysW [Kofleriaceae bacterium]|nr:sulfate ABC transporter permease subunit CysW [Kofleriaceae bacterium]